MSNNTRRHWDVVEEKREAIVAVLKYLQSASDDVRNGCVVPDDNPLRKLFEDPKIGNIDVPQGIKTVAVPINEREKKAKGSVVIELPPAGEGTVVDEPPDPILVHLLCCYKVW